jgi:hypothetical protein
MGNILKISFYLIGDERFSSKVLVLLIFAKLPMLKLYSCITGRGMTTPFSPI